MSRLNRLRKNSKSVIPRARFARGICFFLGIGKKQIPRFARDDIKLLFSAASEAVTHNALASLNLCGSRLQPRHQGAKNVGLSPLCPHLDHSRDRELFCRSAQDRQQFALGADHRDRGDQRALAFFRTSSAIARDFFGDGLPRAGRETVTRKKIGPVGHGKEARDFAAPRRAHRRLHQAVADVAALPARFGSDRERADFGEVWAVRFERNAAEDFFIPVAFFDEHEETRDMFPDFRLGAREQKPLAGVVRDHAVHRGRVALASRARPHDCFPSAARRSFAAAMALRTRAGAVPPSTSGPARADSSFNAS